MKRWETYAALLAVVMASLSAVAIGGRTHPLLAFCAIVLLLVVGYSRLRAQMTAPRRRAGSAYDRALRIQEERDRRFRRL
ncbi:MAG TPA: hypothetical protein VFA29_10960 [Candidatus Baltobacteraceae bacterium]|nr:hypothetical protein [Candidatus Baltobacteraceae bacterium]